MAFLPKPIVDRSGLGELERNIAPPMPMSFTIPVKFGEFEVTAYIAIPAFGPSAGTMYEVALHRVATFIADAIEEKGERQCEATNT
jgi:hypothetical protein